MAMTFAGQRRQTVRLMLVASIVGLVLLANLPVTTSQGVDSEISTHRLPLYLKAFEFLDRNAQYRQLANEITRGADSDRQRVEAVFNWTRRRIQPAPAGWPVVDDHVLNIIIRGYGVSDQRADVFATLVTYAGVPAFWQNVKASGTRDGVVLAFARVDGRWIVADVANGFLFRTTRGDLAVAEDFAAQQAILPPAAAALMTGSTPYSRVFTQLRTPPIPRPLRAELQMPWPRLWDRTRHAVGYEPDDGSER
jgi:hypothetical protein